MPALNLTAELNNLAELHAHGQLTDAEFATAKTRLLNGDPSPAPRVLNAPPSISFVAIPWTEGTIVLQANVFCR